MIDVGVGVGALVVYAPAELQGHEIEISPKGNDSNRAHAEFLRRTTAAGQVYAAVFGSLPEGHYRLWHKIATEPTEVQIFGGEISEVHWR